MNEYPNNDKNPIDGELNEEGNQFAGDNPSEGYVSGNNEETDGNLYDNCGTNDGSSYDNNYSVDTSDENFEDETVRNDSYYMNEVNSDNSSGSEKKSPEFFTKNVKHSKKKKYISVPAAIVALVCTAAFSITGGAMLANYGPFTPKTQQGNANNTTASTVQDNINKSDSVKGQKTDVNKLQGQPLSTPEVVDLVGPAVVGIINKTTFGDAYGQYGSLFGDLNEEIQQSSGSGVVISSDGYIVTNNHVVEDATALTVILSTGEELEAKLVGKDATTDLAVIKIEKDGLIYAQMGVSSSLRVGEKAIAIGNPLGQEFAGTTTEGIISGLNRSVTIEDKTMNLIQTDAAINPGNSGGALVNEYGQLIGINTAKISSEQLEGLGFAIPIDEAKPIIQDLMTNGFVKGRPVIGIAGRAVTEKDAQAYNMKVGVYVASLSPNGPAYMAGMKIGDIIVECAGQEVKTVDDINAIKNKMSPNDELEMKVYRKGDYVNVKIILGEDSPNNQQ